MDEQKFNPTSIFVEEKKTESTFSKAIKTFLKIAVTVFCVWYVVKKIEWQTAWQTIRTSNWLWLAAGTFFFTASKIVSAFRLNIFFRNIDVHLSEKTNLKLNWLGMFYNVFLPGGVGGDAYKIIALKRTYNYSARLLTAAVFLDRVSGVAAIGILSIVYYYIVFHGGNYALLLAIAILPGMIIYYFIVQKFFPSFVIGFQPTFWLGLLVQGLQVVCVYCIIFALHLNNDQSAYIFIFLLSSLVAVLPIFFGPLGAREIVFIWGSTQFLLNRNESVCISLLFDLMNIAVSMIGIYWMYKNPLKKNIIA